MIDLENANLSEETKTRIMVYEIRERNPEAVQFVPDDCAIKMILSYMNEKRFDKIIYSFGAVFVKEILKLFEEYENYEMCSLISEEINKIDNLTK